MRNSIYKVGIYIGVDF